uniref:Pentraxin (PTX) domain-containing protein n=1 Tax=Strigamia maritima TaxID=126957 RepID=T1JDF1_STRMM
MGVSCNVLETEFRHCDKRQRKNDTIREYKLSKSVYFPSNGEMKWILVVLVLVGVSSVNSLTRRFQITFPGGNTYSYAKLYGTIDRPLNDFTLCHWSRTNVNNELHAAVFSYAVSDEHNSILTFIQHNKAIQFGRNLMLTEIKTNIQSINWIQTCVTWSILQNSCQVFVNGERFGNGSGIGSKPVPPNGVVILGQEQDGAGEKFDINQALTGQISELHLWDYILTPHTIKQVSRCDPLEEGNIIAWSQATWALYNGTRISPVDLPCTHPQ